MGYKEQIKQAKHAAVKWREEHPIVGVGELRVDCMVDDLCRSITELLSRAEAAEAMAEKYKLERDIAIGDILEAAPEPCLFCKHNLKNKGNCDMIAEHHEMFSCWEWKGLEE